MKTTNHSSKYKKCEKKKWTKDESMFVCVVRLENILLNTHELENIL